MKLMHWFTRALAHGGVTTNSSHSISFQGNLLTKTTPMTPQQSRILELVPLKSGASTSLARTFGILWRTTSKVHKISVCIGNIDLENIIISGQVKYRIVIDRTKI